MNVTTMQQVWILKYIKLTFHKDMIRTMIIDGATVRVTDRLGEYIDLKCRDCEDYCYKVSTIKQFKILQYLYKKMPMGSYIKKLTIISKDTIRATDRVGDNVDFKYENDEIKTFSRYKM